MHLFRNEHVEFEGETCANSKMSGAVQDEYYRYDGKAYAEKMKAMRKSGEKVEYKKVMVSSLALLKMLIHGQKGGTIEVMGILLGYVQGDTFIISDSYALPVEGTETRVNAQEEAIEYIIQYKEYCEKVGRLENAVGWYHSHPNYGCWLSGIDVTTQRLNQTYQDPWLAIVIDPIRTLSLGKVDIGAFRVIVDEEEAKVLQSSKQWIHIPQDKIDDYGVHASEYVPLEIRYYRSSYDSHLLAQMCKDYWQSTLSSSTLIPSLPIHEELSTRMWSQFQQMKGSHGSLRELVEQGEPWEKQQLQSFATAMNKICADQSSVLLRDQYISQVFQSAELDFKQLFEILTQFQ